MVIAIYVLGAILLYSLVLILAVHVLFPKAPYNKRKRKDVIIVLGYPPKKRQVIKGVTSASE